MSIVTMTVPQMLRSECHFRGHRVKLPPLQGNVLATLLIRGCQPTPMEVLIDAAYGHLPDGGPEQADNCISVCISRLRRQLPGAIKGRYGFGFFIDPGDDDEAAATA